ncbi:MAG TPA: polysaccharide biosynthesis C-terminal domain-containing protein [Firmicutes bacterium]|nr:polysaccharide biosynthesis C-terminal domain-containing protein [Bacillota bacterium]
MRRTRNSIINSVAGAGGYLVQMFSNFVVRAKFVECLGESVLGVNALFSNIISMLALAELGLGTGLIYKLYKPVADHDVPRIQSLLRFYKRAYMLIGSVILVLGFILSFFVYLFDKDRTFSQGYMGLTFFLFVLDVLASYLFAHQKALITADQKNYIINIAHAGAQLATCILQIILLVTTQSFVLYILAKILCRVGEGLVVYFRYRKLYPDISLRNCGPIDREERRDLFHNINAMLYHKVGSFSLTSTSNMIITYFVNLVMGGIYSNYTLITNTLNNLIAQMFQGVTASFGDLIHTEKRERAYEKFNVLYFVNFLLVSFCTTGLLVMIQPFVTLWLGERYLLGQGTLLLILLYFYIYSMRRVIFLARDSAGLYRPDKYMPLIEAGVNLGLAFLLVRQWGVNGVLIANLVSMLLIPFWIQPVIVYKYIFQRSARAYFLRYGLYFAATVASAGATYFLCSWIPSDWNLWLSLLARGILCLIVPNALNLLFFIRTEECRYVFRLATEMLGKFTGKIRRKKA